MLPRILIELRVICELSMLNGFQWKIALGIHLHLVSFLLLIGSFYSGFEEVFMSLLWRIQNFLLVVKRRGWVCLLIPVLSLFSWTLFVLWAIFLNIRLLERYFWGSRLYSLSILFFVLLFGNEFLKQLRVLDFIEICSSIGHSLWQRLPVIHHFFLFILWFVFFLLPIHHLLLCRPFSVRWLILIIALIVFIFLMVISFVWSLVLLFNLISKLLLHLLQPLCHWIVFIIFILVISFILCLTGRSITIIIFLLVPHIFFIIVSNIELVLSLGKNIIFYFNLILLMMVILII